MGSVTICSSCRRHIRIHDGPCPFCGAHPGVEPARLLHASVMIVMMAVGGLSGCLSDADEDSGDTYNDLYGGSWTSYTSVSTSTETTGYDDTTGMDGGTTSTTGTGDECGDTSDSDSDTSGSDGTETGDCDPGTTGDDTGDSSDDTAMTAS